MPYGVMVVVPKAVSQVYLQAVSNVVTQGVGMAVGLQKKFDWTSVAIAGVVGGVATEVGKMGWVQGQGPVAQSIIVGTASLLAGAATRSLITGQDFGKSLREALPDAIASTVGNMIAGAVKSKIDEAQTKTPAEMRAEAKYNGHILQKPDLSAFETPNLVDKYRVSKLDLDAIAPWSRKYTLESGQTLTDISRASLLAQGYTKDQITQALILKQNLAIMADNHISSPSRLRAGTHLTVREIGADRDPALLKIATRNYGRDNASVQQRRTEIAAAKAYNSTWAIPAFYGKGGLFNGAGNYCTSYGTWTRSGNTPSSSIEAHMDYGEFVPKTKLQSTLSSLSSGTIMRSWEAHETIRAGQAILDSRSYLNTGLENAGLTFKGYLTQAGGYLQGGTVLLTGGQDTIFSYLKGDGGWVSPRTHDDTDFTQTIGSLFLGVKGAARAAGIMPKAIGASRSEAAASIWQARSILRGAGLNPSQRGEIIRSFDLRTFRVERTISDTKAYRLFDDSSARLEGRYVSGDFFSNQTDRIQNFALMGNSATRLGEVTIPKGSVVFTGRVAPQLRYSTGLRGGANQTFLTGPLSLYTYHEIPMPR